MITAEARNQPGLARWGRGILIAISALLVLNGIGWFFMGPSLSTFEQDTGVPLAEFRAAYPTVAKLVALQARNTAILLAGFGLLSLAIALAGRRGGQGWAGWAIVGTLAGIGLSELASGAAFGLFYLVFSAVALLGQILASREAAG